MWWLVCWGGHHRACHLTNSHHHHHHHYCEGRQSQLSCEGRAYNGSFRLSPDTPVRTAKVRYLQVAVPPFSLVRPPRAPSPLANLYLARSPSLPSSRLHAVAVPGPDWMIRRCSIAALLVPGWPWIAQNGPQLRPQFLTAPYSDLSWTRIPEREQSLAECRLSLMYASCNINSPAAETTST